MRNMTHGNTPCGMTQTVRPRRFNLTLSGATGPRRFHGASSGAAGPRRFNGASSGIEIEIYIFSASAKPNRRVIIKSKMSTLRAMKTFIRKKMGHTT